MNFLLNGAFLEKGSWKKFSRLIDADSEKLAREKALCLFGSEYRLQRKKIRIDSVKEHKGEK